MMKSPTPLLPLFPLEVVLFPGSSLPLHIFEARYKKMIRECLEKQSEFGVVLVEGQSLAEVGCTARILEVVRRYDDGRLDIVTEGKRRFELLYQNLEEDILRGEVAYFDDEEVLASLELDHLKKSVMGVYSKIVLTVARPHTNVSLVDIQTPRLSFSIAGHLGVALDVCQKLLSLRSEADRLQELGRYLEDILPRIAQMERAQHQAGGNGHLT